MEIKRNLLLHLVNMSLQPVKDISSDPSNSVNLIWDSESKKLIIEGFENVSRILLCNTAGTIIPYNDSNENFIDFSSLDNGLYIISIFLNNGQVFSTRVLK